MIIGALTLVVIASFLFEADARRRTWKTSAGLILLCAAVVAFISGI